MDTTVITKTYIPTTLEERALLNLGKIKIDKGSCLNQLKMLDLFEKHVRYGN